MNGDRSKLQRVAMENWFQFQFLNSKSKLAYSVLGKMATSQWDSQSNLLLLQLIYKYGDPYTPSAAAPAATTPVFEQIAQQLANHSLIRPSKRKFSASVFTPHRMHWFLVMWRTLYWSSRSRVPHKRVFFLSRISADVRLSLPTTASANKKGESNCNKLADY